MLQSAAGGPSDPLLDESCVLFSVSSGTGTRLSSGQSPHVAAVQDSSTHSLLRMNSQHSTIACSSPISFLSYLGPAAYNSLFLIHDYTFMS